MLKKGDFISTVKGLSRRKFINNSFIVFTKGPISQKPLLQPNVDKYFKM